MPPSPMTSQEGNKCTTTRKRSKEFTVLIYILCLGKSPTFFPSFHGPIIVLGRRGHLKNRHSSQPNSFYIRYSVSYLYYRISANSFRGNYSFLNLTLCTVTFGVTVHTGAETIRGNTVFRNITQ